MSVEPVKEFKTPIAEGGTAKYKCNLIDDEGVAVLPAAINVFQVTLDDPASGPVINGRDAQPALTNGGTVSSGGAFVFQLSTGDTITIGTARLQRRRLTFHIEFEGGAVLNRKIIWYVRNLTHID
jgi:hypothetical protein